MTKNYILNSIGYANKKNNEFQINISNKYIQGLRHLSSFSHIILLIDKTKSNIFNAPFSQYLFRINEIDEKKGWIYVSIPSPLNEVIDFNVYDIKPFFPNEDRIREARIDGDYPSDNSLFENQNNFTYLGTIQKSDNTSLLQIDASFDSLVEYLSKGTHIKIFWWFHKFDKPKYKNSWLCKPPYENAPETGVFATRSPVRPNSIAMTTAKILSIDLVNQCIIVSKLDCFDDTPLIGVGLYNPMLDNVENFELPKWLAHWNGYAEDQQIQSGCLPKLQSNLIVESQSGLRNEVQARTPLERDTTTIRKVENEIVIQGARQNNLKNIDVKIPHGQMTVITGVSGSGKSSLAFDTILAESQQRFFANMSLSEKGQFHLPERPDVDTITGLPPAICLSQQNSITNSRSTVGTLTNIHDMLRTIYSSIGIRHCPNCGKEIVKLSADEIVSRLFQTEENTHLQVYPYGHQNHMNEFIIGNNSPQTIKREMELVVDEYLEIGAGAIVVCFNHQLESIMQTTEKCYDCNYILFELSPSDFSYNNSESYCTKCKGTGEVLEIDIDKIIEYPDKSILDCASNFWGNLRKFAMKPNANWSKCEILALAQNHSIDLELPWKDLPKHFKDQALFGTQDEVSYTYSSSTGRAGTITRRVEGAYNIIKRLNEKSKTMNERYLSKHTCDICLGERLKMESRIVTVVDDRFPTVASMSIQQIQKWVKKLHNILSAHEYDLVKNIIQELYNKTVYLMVFGLSYLELNRISPSLSGGELQRVQLVNQLSSNISNVLYILDEPSNALHPKNYEKLIELLNNLKALNNTILLVEHTPAIINKADYIVDIGGGSGENGGYVLATGSPQDIIDNELSKTGKYLSNKQKLCIPKKRNLDEWISIKSIRGNNLKNIDIKFPFNSLICLTGVSGSGKSSVMTYGIIPALTEIIVKKDNDNERLSYSSIVLDGDTKISKLIYIDQKPIGRSSRSTPATYIGISDDIRDLFASTKEAKLKGYSVSAFSFNNREGQCSKCKGYGYIELNHLASSNSKSVCPLCHGKKFNNNISSILYKQKGIHEIYEMNVDTALDFFYTEVKIYNKLLILADIGLGYLQLGQSSLTLSGGESQRVKLASELIKTSEGKIVYLLDEPTSGLHYSDIQNLLDVFNKLREAGHTIILIEHNLDVAVNADWIIDLGKEGGYRGGAVIAQGTPNEVSCCADSYTGQYLQKYLHSD